MSNTEYLKPSELATTTKVWFDQVSIDYQTDEGTFTAVRDVDLKISDGEFVTIVGPSGCGKTSLLKALGGLIRPSAGTLEIARSKDETETTHAIVFQEPRLLPWRTILGNVAFPLEKRTINPEQRTQRAVTEIRRVGLGAFANRYPQQLSGGMQQRVNLARALVVDPDVLLLDEPFAALDAQTREHMQQELLRIWGSQRKTALFVTHQVDEAIFLADRVVVLSRGPGTVKAIFNVPFGRPRDLAVKRTREFHEFEDTIWASIDVVHDESETQAWEAER